MLSTVSACWNLTRAAASSPCCASSRAHACSVGRWRGFVSFARRKYCRALPAWPAAASIMAHACHEAVWLASRFTARWNSWRARVLGPSCASNIAHACTHAPCDGRLSELDTISSQQPAHSVGALQYLL